MREKLGVSDRISIKMNGQEVAQEPQEQADCIRIVGEVEAVLRGPDGAVKQRFKGHNLIVTNGKNGIADQILASPTVTKPTHMGVGTGAVAPAAGDAALGAEIGTRAAVTKTRNNNVLTFVGSYAAGNATGAITEAGIFTASTAGTMYSRITFSVINKGANDSLDLTWTWTIG